MVAGSQPLFAEALSAGLERLGAQNCLLERPATGLDAVWCAISKKPDVCLIDYWMPDMEGPAATSLILARHPTRKVILLGWFYTSREVDKAMAAGAAGFFPTSLGLLRLGEFVREVHFSDASVFPPELERGPGPHVKGQTELKDLYARIRSLSRREIEIISLMSRDHSIKEISDALGIRPGTVKAYLREILVKSGTSAQREVVALAKVSGLIRE
ncbi:MAG: response regulator transcription factor [Actinomycetota bacterium]